MSDVLQNLSADDRAAVEALLAKRRAVSPAVLDTPSERLRIVAALRQGCQDFDGTPDCLVNINAHDIMVLVRWIDELQGATPRHPPAPETTA